MLATDIGLTNYAPVIGRSWFIIAVASVAVLGCGESESEPPACYEPTTLSSTDICTLLGDACAAQVGDEPALSESVQVVPDASAMPEGVVSQQSHNNLDIIWHGGRLYFAFRTAPTHFASDRTVLYVVSTVDQRNWELETAIALGTDLREPRFMAIGDRLLMYFAVLGDFAFAFEPQYAMVTELESGCRWSEPEQVLEDEFIPWRAKTIDEISYLIGYVGGENIYAPSGDKLKVLWRKTDDGRVFDPVVAGQPVVLEGGMSETDFAMLRDGSVIAVSRNEAGDEDFGFGSLICRAEAGSLGDWRCEADPKKYDSPLVFVHDGRAGEEVYLVGRRNVTDDGAYDLGRKDLSLEEQASLYNREYWTEPKRCALWRVDADDLTVEHVLDLPSNGDTCFASIVPLGEGRYLLYNYTSPLEDPELSWVDGQTGPTFIYRTTLTLP